MPRRLFEFLVIFSPFAVATGFWIAFGFGPLETAIAVSEAFWPLTISAILTILLFLGPRLWRDLDAE